MGDDHQDWGEGHVERVGVGGSECEVVRFWGVGVFLSERIGKIGGGL